VYPSFSLVLPSSDLGIAEEALRFFTLPSSHFVNRRSNKPFDFAKHGRYRVAQHQKMDCDVSCLHQRQENDGRRKTHRGRQSLRKPYLCRNRRLL